jgi:hypothetical protein
MPVNLLTEACICHVREAMVFWSPSTARLNRGTCRAQAQPRLHGRVQIVDVFSLEVATGYSRDPQGRLLLHAAPSVAEGRSWSLAKAAQLIRNDVRPHRWVALQLDNRAWGLFWAGGGLQRCRELLAEQINATETCLALVPATPEALLRLVLNLESEAQAAPRRGPWPQAATSESGISPTSPNPWKLVAWTSLAWMAVLSITVAGFLGALERQERKLDLLLERSLQTNQPAS